MGYHALKTVFFFGCLEIGEARSARLPIHLPSASSKICWRVWGSNRERSSNCQASGPWIKPSWSQSVLSHVNVDSCVCYVRWMCQNYSSEAQKMTCFFKINSICLILIPTAPVGVRKWWNLNKWLVGTWQMIMFPSSLAEAVGLSLQGISWTWGWFWDWFPIKAYQGPKSAIWPTAVETQDGSTIRQDLVV